MKRSGTRSQSVGTGHRLDERAHVEQTHELRVGAGAVEARLVGDDPVAFVVMLEHVVTSWNMQIRV